MNDGAAEAPVVDVVWTHAAPSNVFAGLLDAEETARMRRFRRDEDRHSYGAGHGLLRLVVGRIAGVDARSLRFAAAPGGRPFVAGPAVPGIAGLCVSLTHTDGFAAVAVGRGLDVGVDAEPIDRPVDPDELADEVLTPEERAELAALPDAAAKRRRFLAIWTLKEACAKGLGLGLALPFASIAVRDGILAGAAPGAAGRAWHLHQELVDGRFILAAAAATTGRRRPVFRSSRMVPPGEA